MTTTNQMTTSNQLTPGMTISVDGTVFRVESSVKVTVARGVPFIKTKLKNLVTGDDLEKTFKLDQPVEEVKLAERRLEYLYLEGKTHLFLDIDYLDQIVVPQEVVGNNINYLKEGIQVSAMLYGTNVFSIELPQFLELMVVKTEDLDAEAAMSASTKLAILETGAKVSVPMFVDTGDIIKVDTLSQEYVQRV
ncbi:MAG: Elongation factor P [Chlamydiia bacterium]|nr:Elongation factor P [Chlamydiia bacterium]